MRLHVSPASAFDVTALMALVEVSLEGVAWSLNEAALVQKAAGIGATCSILHGLQVENDVYCTYGNRANYEAKWSPVSAHTDISTLSGAL